MFKQDLERVLPRVSVSVETDSKAIDHCQSFVF